MYGARKIRPLTQSATNPHRFLTITSSWNLLLPKLLRIAFSLASVRARCCIVYASGWTGRLQI